MELIDKSFGRVSFNLIQSSLLTVFRMRTSRRDGYPGRRYVWQLIASWWLHTLELEKNSRNKTAIKRQSVTYFSFTMSFFSSLSFSDNDALNECTCYYPTVYKVDLYWHTLIVGVDVENPSQFVWRHVMVNLQYTRKTTSFKFYSISRLKMFCSFVVFALGIRKNNINNTTSNRSSSMVKKDCITEHGKCRCNKRCFASCVNNTKHFPIL